MKFEKGHIKQGGRQKGTPNRTTKTAREKLFKFVENEVKNLPSYISELTAKERLDFFAKILPYVLPKVHEPNAQEEITALLSNLDALTQPQLLRLREIIIQCNGRTEGTN